MELINDIEQDILNRTNYVYFKTFHFNSTQKLNISKCAWGPRFTSSSSLKIDPLLRLANEQLNILLCLLTIVNFRYPVFTKEMYAAAWCSLDKYRVDQNWVVRIVCLKLY